MNPLISTNNNAPRPGRADGCSQPEGKRRVLFERISLTEGDVGGQTSRSSACTEAGLNLAKELRRSVRFLFLSNRFFRVVADWGRQLQYRTVLWEGSSSSPAFFGEEKKPMASQSCSASSGACCPSVASSQDARVLAGDNVGVSWTP